MENESEFIETRRSQRIPIDMHLEVFSIFKQNHVHVNNINASIDIVDISKHGIGFVSKNVFPIGFYFDSKLYFKDNNNSIKCVIRIVRRKKREDGLTLYGCEFVGLSPVFDYIFDDIQKEYNDRTN